MAQTDSDFPNLWGTIIYEPWLSAPLTPEAIRFARFVALNKESTRLVDMEDQVVSSREQEVVNAELEAEFMDVVESEGWRLVDDCSRGVADPVSHPPRRRRSGVAVGSKSDVAQTPNHTLQQTVGAILVSGTL